MRTDDLPALEIVPDDFLSAGDVIAGRYRIEHAIGSGGFARVFLASHLEVESLKVAIKIIHPHRVTPESLTRFRNEAMLLARLRNRHTVRLTDFGITEEGIAYLVMEYVEGTPLDRVIHARGHLGEADVARVGIGVLKALIEAHTTGVIHRDLKPANIMMVAELGEKYTVPRVLDFGIARVLGGGSPVEDHIVRPDGSYEPVVYCTPAYAAPELLRGRPEYSTDLYALGLVMCEMLDGRSPYEFPDGEPENSPHLWPTPVPLGPRASASLLAPILERALAKSLAARYPSAEAMLEDLERVYDAMRSDRAVESSLDVSALASLPPAPPQPPTRPGRFVDTSEIGSVSDTVAELRRQARERAQAQQPPPPIAGPERSAPRAAESADAPTLLRVTPPSTARARPVDTVVSSAPTSVHDRTTAPPAAHAPDTEVHLPRREDSRLAEVALFGRRITSTRARGLAVVIAILAILLPALIAAWSALTYVNDGGSDPQVVPDEEP